MARAMKTQTHGSGEDMEIIELGVVVAMQGHDPSLIKPSYLRDNGIVSPDLSAGDDLIVSPFLSRVTFSGTSSIVIMGDPNRLIVEQEGLGLSVDDMVTARIAEAYLRKRKALQCTAVGINPKLFMSVGDSDRRRISNLLAPNPEWAHYKDASPDVRVGVRYRFSDRTITLHIDSMTDKSDRRGIVFQGNIHRDIVKTTPQDQTEKAMAVLRSWKEDLSDFDSLVRLFDLTEPAP